MANGLTKHWGLAKFVSASHFVSDSLRLRDSNFRQNSLGVSMFFDPGVPCQDLDLFVKPPRVLTSKNVGRL